LRRDQTKVIRYTIVSIVSGVLFGAMDGLIYANPIAENLYEAYGPIRKTSVDVFAGVLIDLAYGFVLAGAFLLLRRSLPGQKNLAKGIAFALMIWFFRVVMSVASTWMTLNLPAGTLVYALLTGLAEMLVLGVLYGVTLKSSI